VTYYRRNKEPLNPLDPDQWFELYKADRKNRMNIKKYKIEIYGIHPETNEPLECKENIEAQNAAFAIAELLFFIANRYPSCSIRKVHATPLEDSK